jgi:hypothetical protein
MLRCATRGWAEATIEPEVLVIVILGILFISGLFIRMVQHWRGSQESGKALPLAPRFATRRSILNCILALLPFLVGYALFKMYERSAEEEERLKRQENEAALARLRRRLRTIRNLTDIPQLLQAMQSPERREQSGAAERLFDLLRDVSVSRLAAGELGHEYHRSTLVFMPPRWYKETSEALERWYAANRNSLELDEMADRFRWNRSVPNAVRRENAYVFEALP